METTELLDFWNTRHRSSDEEAVPPAAVPVLVRAEPPDGLTPKTALSCCCPVSHRLIPQIKNPGNAGIGPGHHLPSRCSLTASVQPRPPLPHQAGPDSTSKYKAVLAAVSLGSIGALLLKRSPEISFPCHVSLPQPTAQWLSGYSRELGPHHHKHAALHQFQEYTTATLQFHLRLCSSQQVCPWSPFTYFTQVFI
ncbi:Golgi apparatus membrane protein TVP23 homolog A isoform X2 [Herpailurus yagouaroundi]|uniref:Golgi apparatus membrane protein TVP23 homolog A isoform X2 n=1 Tax=Herpailurus yagouaroundi TaxID=1608482 RepID=UPI001AD773DF|nr:Golgi apparatus membrane protein TVP23 homolog A isoform X2 [Puma yagouaroundi]